MSQLARTAPNDEDPQHGAALELPTEKADGLVTREKVNTKINLGRLGVESEADTVVNSPNNRATAFLKLSIGATIIGGGPMLGGYLLAAPGWLSLACGSATTLGAVIAHCVRRDKR
jgi:hypothetical protein